ncbi:MAG: hypothetical protein PHH01_02985 [Patescibacteria group bacterium]|nr:hypothetical protein [Patescibacteria group bacterium]
MGHVLVVGTGTIGRPLLGLLEKWSEPLGITGLAVHKNSPQETTVGAVKRMLSRGAVQLVTEESTVDAFKGWGLKPSMTRPEALQWADVVADCTPAGLGHMNGKYVRKDKATGRKVVTEGEAWYEPVQDRVRGFFAQGSEEGFGMPFALGINEEPTNGVQRLQIVSCNTHNLSVIVDVIKGMGLKILDGDFVAIRRCTDISQAEMIASPKVDAHNDERFGTHHAKDAWRVYQTLGLDLPLFSSSLQVPTQYMHVIRFSIQVDKPPTAMQVVDAFRSRPYVAITQRVTAEQIFSEARDCGFNGRILDQTVVAVKTISVVGNRIVGFCFTPQDGNSLLTSVAATARFLNPEDWKQRMGSLVDRYHFGDPV